MAAANKNDKRLAKRLASLIIEKGKEGVSELRPALERILAGRPASERRRFLNLFRRIVTREVANNTLTVESAQAVENEVLDAIEKSFAQKHSGRLYRESRENPHLIAGLRVRLGDTIYDASLRGKLDNLQSKIH